MKLHEQVAIQKNQIERALELIQLFREHLASDKFISSETELRDMINVRDVDARLIQMRNVLEE